MFRRLGDAVPQSPHELVPDLVLAALDPLVGEGEQVGVQVATVLVLELGEEVHVIDAAAFEDGIFWRNTDVPHAVPERALNTVAQADGVNAVASRRPLAARVQQRLHVHAHRIAVVQQPTVRLGHFSNVLGKVTHERIRSQRPEQPTWPGRVGNGEVEAVLPRDLEVDERRVEPADLNHADDKVGVSHRLSAVHRLFDLRMRPKGPRRLLAQLRPDLEAVGIDIHVGEGRVFERFVLQQVTGQVSTEDDATGADHCDFVAHVDLGLSQQSQADVPYVTCESTPYHANSASQ